MKGGGMEYSNKRKPKQNEVRGEQDANNILNTHNTYVDGRHHCDARIIVK